MLVARKLSNIEKDKCDDTSSIIFSIHTRSSTRSNKSFNVGQLEDIPLTSTTRTTATSSIDEEQQKIDRILFNLYADMASVLRSIETCATPENNTDSQLNSNIIAALTECIDQFFRSQPQGLSNVILKLFDDRESSSVSCQTASQGPNLNKRQILNSNDRASAAPMNTTRDDDPMNELSSNKQNRNRNPLVFSENSSSKRSTDNLDQLSYYSLKRRFGNDDEDNHIECIKQSNITRDFRNLAIYNQPISNKQNQSSTVVSETYEVIDIETYEQTGYVPPSSQKSNYTFPVPFKVEAFSPIPPDMRQYPRYFNESSSHSDTEFRFTQNALDEQPNQNNSFQRDNVDMFDAGFQAATTASVEEDIFEFPTQSKSVFNVPLHTQRGDIESSQQSLLDFDFTQHVDGSNLGAKAQDSMQIGGQSQWMDSFQFDSFENQNVANSRLMTIEKMPRRSGSQISGRLSLEAIKNHNTEAFDTNSGFFSNFCEYKQMNVSKPVKLTKK